MTMLEKIYTQLRSLQLVRNAQAFSVEYLARNKNWYSYQTHMGREISFSTAVACALHVQSQLQHNTLSEQQRVSLLEIMHQLEAHLSERHKVTWLATSTWH